MKIPVRFLVLILILLVSFQIHSQEAEDLFSSEYFETQHFAHRGGYYSGTENTIPTILSNLTEEVTSIEIDIRLTRDGELILFHDETIKRLLDTDDDIAVSELSLEELRQIPFRRDQQDQKINSLTELFDTLAVFIPANNIHNFLLELDFKPHGKRTGEAAEKLMQILDKYNRRFGPGIYKHFFVSSFYPAVLKELHKKNKNIITAFAINSSPAGNRLAAKLAIAFAPYVIGKYEVEIIEPNICMVTERFVKKWHRRGLLINAYTANSQCEKDYLAKFHVAYTTNCPSGYCKGDPSDEPGRPINWCRKCQKK